MKYFPYQLYPDLPSEKQDRWTWYRKLRVADNEEKMKMYTALLQAHGVGVGIDFKFGGTVANTLDAHRVIQHYQEENGPEAADAIINC